MQNQRGYPGIKCIVDSDEGGNGTGWRKLPLNEQRVERQAIELTKASEQPKKSGRAKSFVSVNPLSVVFFKFRVTWSSFGHK